MYRMVDNNFNDIPRMECKDYEALCVMASIYTQGSENRCPTHAMIVGQATNNVYSIFFNGIRYNGRIKPSPQKETPEEIREITSETNSVSYDDLERIINAEKYFVVRNMEIKYDPNDKIWSVEVGNGFPTTADTLEQAMKQMINHFPEEND